MQFCNVLKSVNLQLQFQFTIIAQGGHLNDAQLHTFTQCLLCRKSAYFNCFKYIEMCSIEKHNMKNRGNEFTLNVI